MHNILRTNYEEKKGKVNLKGRKQKYIFVKKRLMD